MKRDRKRSRDIEIALKRGATYRRRMRSDRNGATLQWKSIQPLASVGILAIGAVMVFLVEDPTTTRLYGKDQVMKQERSRRGEELPGTPYEVIGYDPFMRQSGISLTIGDAFFRVSAGVDGDFFVDQGTIVIAKSSALDVGEASAVGKPQITRSRLIPAFIRNAADDSMVEGGKLNVTSAIRKFAPGFPVFRLPDNDRILAEQGGVESVAQTAEGFAVVYSDGTTPLDWASMAVLAFGIIMTLRVVFA